MLTRIIGLALLLEEKFMAFFSEEKRLAPPKTSVVSQDVLCLTKSEKNQKIREDFYNSLREVIKAVPKRDLLILGGDFNAQTGSSNLDHPDIVGKFGKNKTNSNGSELVEFCLENNLVLTNTYFQHKLAHITTWQGPKLPSRKNPLRKQIDYIAVRKQHQHLIQDARSYSGTHTKSDHRLVIAKIKCKIPHPKMQRDTNIQRKYDLSQLKVKQNEYEHAVKTNIEKHCWQNLKQQEKWNLVVNSCHDATSTTVSKIDPKRKSNDPRVIQLSKEQKEIHAKINSNISEDKRKELKKQRNNMQHEIRKILTEEKHRDIIESIEDIERLKDESAKMFKAVRVVKRAKPKKQLLIESENGVTSNDKDQVKIIGNFFEKFFDDENYQQIENIEPTEMKIPFTPKEIENATNNLKKWKKPRM